jgi:hypothetical protein
VVDDTKGEVEYQRISLLTLDYLDVALAAAGLTILVNRVDFLATGPLIDADPPSPGDSTTSTC